MPGKLDRWVWRSLGVAAARVSGILGFPGTRNRLRLLGAGRDAVSCRGSATALGPSSRPFARQVSRIIGFPGSRHRPVRDDRRTRIPPLSALVAGRDTAPVCLDRRTGMCQLRGLWLARTA